MRVTPIAFAAASLICSAATAQTFTRFPIATDPGDQYFPHAGGSLVLWTHIDPTAAMNHNVYGYDVLTKQRFTVSDAPGMQAEGDTDGTRLVWADSRMGYPGSDVYGRDSVAGPEYVISEADGGQSWPAIAGDISVWHDSRNGDSDIYARNLRTGSEFVVATGPAMQSFPDVSDRFVVWTSYPDQQSHDGDIWAYDLQTGQQTHVAAGPANQLFPAVSGSLVVWQDWRSGRPRIFARDLLAADSREFAVSLTDSDQIEPDVSGSIVV
jgi:beta propeller repeat protein